MEENKTPVKKGLYLLPSFFTLMNMAFGYYAIIAALKGNLKVAGAVITIAILMDGLDGRVARLTKTTSEFGVNFDSLVDLVSFGMAPAIVIYYKWFQYIPDYKNVGWIISFLFVAAGAIRLARFNVSAKQDLPNVYFSGLPIPAGAGLLSTLLWMHEKYFINSPSISSLYPKAMPIIVIILSYLMVSNIKYYSFKKMKNVFKKPLLLIITILFVLFLMFTIPSILLFVIALSYVLLGPIHTIFKIAKITNK